MQSKFFIMGLLDAVSNFMVTIPAAYVGYASCALMSVWAHAYTM